MGNVDVNFGKRIRYWDSSTQDAVNEVLSINSTCVNGAGEDTFGWLLQVVNDAHDPSFYPSFPSNYDQDGTASTNYYPGNFRANGISSIVLP